MCVIVYFVNSLKIYYDFNKMQLKFNVKHVFSWLLFKAQIEILVFFFQWPAWKKL